MKGKSNKKKRVYIRSFRESVIKEVLDPSCSVSAVSAKYNLSRKTIYAWKKKYEQAPNCTKKNSLDTKYKSGKEHYRFTTHYAENPLIRLVIKYPNWGCRRYSRALKNKGINLGYIGVYNFLEDNGLNTVNLRETFTRNYSGPGRYKFDIRTEIVNKAIEGSSISALSREYSISRKTIYTWLSKYNAAGRDRDVLKDAYKEGNDHYNSLDPTILKRILDLVANNPSLSAHKLAQQIPASVWSIWNILNENKLNTYSQRLAYAASRNVDPIVDPVPGFSFIKTFLHSLTPNMAPAPPPSRLLTRSTVVKPFLYSVIVSFLGGLGLRYWINIIVSAPSLSISIGILFASLSLLMGTFFFLYSFKYYLSLALVLSSSEESDAIDDEQKNYSYVLKRIFGSDNRRGNLRRAPGLNPNISSVQLSRHPYISVQIPFFNEKYVAERAIRAAINFDYKGEYEVLVCDDSTDETTQIITNYMNENATYIRKIENKKEGWTMMSGEVRPGVMLKHLHRTTRNGYKGAALGLALKLVDKRTEFVSIFDADFVPYPDSLDLFLKYFKSQNNGSEFYKSSNIAAVQGYQWHVLNKSENWITRGVRSEYSGSYVIERAAQEIYGGLKHISGSVYMIRRDVLDKVGWKSSITEDFELTLRLYEQGFRVLYTPYIQAPAECVSTLKRLIRQRMRWAEGHCHNVKLMWKRLLWGRWVESNDMDSLMHGSTVKNSETLKQSNNEPIFVPSPLTIAEKVEFLFNIPYYLQAFFFIVGTLSWLVAETIFQARLPFWTTLWGWSLVLTNMFALPLVNAVGLFLEESEDRDYVGLFSFIALSYIVVPFQAYASIKGFLEKEEGGWFRTPKTGVITDVFNRKFYSFLSRIIHQGNSTKNSISQQYLAIKSGNNTFNTFSIVPSVQTSIGNVVVITFIILSVVLSMQGSTIQQGTLSDLPVQARVERLGDESDVLADIRHLVSGDEAYASFEIKPVTLMGRQDVSLVKIANTVFSISFIMILVFLVVRRVRSALMRNARKFATLRQTL